VLNHAHPAGITFEAFAKFMGVDCGAEPAAVTQRPTDRKVHRKGGGTVCPSAARGGGRAGDSLLAAHELRTPRKRNLVERIVGPPREVGGVGAGAEAPRSYRAQTDGLEPPTPHPPARGSRYEEVEALSARPPRSSRQRRADGHAHGAGDLSSVEA
jgi:hypothetical protein